MQKVSNPVPRIRHPDWLHRRVAGAVDKFKQNKVTAVFFACTTVDSQSQSQTQTQIDIEQLDMEDFARLRPADSSAAPLGSRLDEPCLWGPYARKAFCQTAQSQYRVCQDV